MIDCRDCEYYKLKTKEIIEKAIGWIIYFALFPEITDKKTKKKYKMKNLR